MAKLAKQEDEEQEIRFSKDSLLRSQKYADYRDVLTALLEDGKAYTHGEVDGFIEKFQKGMVR